MILKRKEMFARAFESNEVYDLNFLRVVNTFEKNSGLFGNKSQEEVVI